MNQDQLDWKKTLTSLCLKMNLDPLVFSAIIEIESSWKPTALKYEPSFVYLVTPKVFCLARGITEQTERALQRFSYGLSQIMGANARSVGHQGDLMELLDPLVNLQISLRFFKQRCGEYVYPQDQAAAWNFGTVKKLTDGSYINQGYVNSFNQAYQQILSESKLGTPASPSA